MMSETINEVMSRRKAFSLLGLAAAAGFVVPATVLTMSDAEAQTAGMQRREGRRDTRQGRRDTRQQGRQQRRSGT